jgi:hypothetical protein
VTRKLSAALAGGALGGLANSAALWGLGYLGVTARLGIAVHPTLTPAWLYPRLVWGGLWGLLLLLPVLRGRPVLRGLLLSLGPSAYALLVVLPRGGQGTLGLALGTLTPALVVLVNALWGVVGAVWYRVASR